MALKGVFVDVELGYQPLQAGQCKRRPSAGVSAGLYITPLMRIEHSRSGGFKRHQLRGAARATGTALHIAS